MDPQRGSIASRGEFFRVLTEVQEFMRRLLGYSPDEPTLRSIAGQLEAMRRWTAEGRTPRAEERSSLDFGARGARELGADDAVLEALAHKLFALQDYFESWPGDERPAPRQRAPGSRGSRSERRALDSRSLSARVSLRVTQGRTAARSRSQLTPARRPSESIAS